MVAYTWNREKQMFIALGKEFDVEKISNIRGKKEIYSGRYFVVKGSLRARKLVKKDETKPKESTAIYYSQNVVHVSLMK